MNLFGLYVYIKFQFGCVLYNMMLLVHLIEDGKLKVKVQ